MWKLKNLLIIVVVLIASLGVKAQQRPITSTYQYNLLPLNPAYAGSLNIFSAIFVHRAQWINVPGAPEISTISAHSSFLSNRVGVGFFANRDAIGPTEDISFYGSYAYKIKTSLGILSMGLSGGFNHRNTDFSQLTILDNRDPYLSGTNRRFAPNFGTGVYFANPVFYAGFSVPYLLENRTLVLEEVINSNDQSRESRNYYFTSGIIFPIGTNLKLSPAFLLRGQEDNRFEWDVSTNLIVDDIAYIGVNVRNSLEITFMGQVILNENFRIGYAYDAATGSLATNNSGSHEILLNYRIKLRNYKKDPQCPVYF